MTQAILHAPAQMSANERIPAETAAEDLAVDASTEPAEIEAEEPATPPVLDTYSLIYAFSWAFLIPGLALLNTQPFRTYDFQYVTYVTLPFLLGMLATFLTDSTDHGKALWLRIAIITPLSLVTGIGILWTLALTTMPISPYLNPENYAFTTPFVVGLLGGIAAPLAWSVWRRVSGRVEWSWRSAVQIAVMLVAIATVIWVGYMMFQPGNALRSFARKDITIYVTGSLMWYLPSFGIGAGIWRKLGLV